MHEIIKERRKECAPKDHSLRYSKVKTSESRREISKGDRKQWLVKKEEKSKRVHGVLEVNKEILQGAESANCDNATNR